MDYEYKKSFLINVTFIVVWLLIGYVAAKSMTGFMLPFVIAVVISFFSNKAANAIGRKTGKNKPWIKITLLLGFYLIAVLLASLAVFLFVRYSGEFFNTLKAYMSSPDNIFSVIKNSVSEKTLRLPEDLKNSLLLMFENLSERLIMLATEAASSFTMSLAKFLPKFFISIVVTVVSSFYITKDYVRLLKFLRLVIGENKFEVLKKIKSIIEGSVLKLFSGYLILSGITFVIVLVAFLIFSVEHAVIFALIVAFIDLLPVLGAGTALIPATVYNFLTGKTTAAVLLILLYITVTLVRNFLEPKLLSQKLNVSPLLMLLTLFIGLRIGGISGMLLLPVLVVVVITYYKKQIEE